MITSMKITGIDAQKGAEKKARNFDALFSFEDLSVNKDEVTLKFTYTAKYKEDGGHIKVSGILVSKESKDALKKIEEERKSKKMPAEYVQSVVNAINYFGASNATVVAQVMGMAPPIRLPKLNFKGKDAVPGSAPAKK